MSQPLRQKCTDNDELIGGRGDDALICGTGSDRLFYRGFFDGRDRVTDFDPTMDVIDISRLKLRGKFQDVVKLEQSGSSTIVRVDPIHHPNFSITLENVNVNALGQGNFKL